MDIGYQLVSAKGVRALEEWESWDVYQLVMGPRQGEEQEQTTIARTPKALPGPGPWAVDRMGLKCGYDRRMA